MNQVHPNPTATTVTTELIRAELQRLWGYSDFRSPQGEIVQCLLEQQDALIILPTGEN